MQYTYYPYRQAWITIFEIEMKYKKFTVPNYIFIFIKYNTQVFINCVLGFKLGTKFIDCKIPYYFCNRLRLLEQ